MPERSRRTDLGLPSGHQGLCSSGGGFVIGGHVCAAIADARRNQRLGVALQPEGRRRYVVVQKRVSYIIVAHRGMLSMAQTKKQDDLEQVLGNFCSHCEHRFGWRLPPMAKHTQPEESAPFYYCPQCRFKQVAVERSAGRFGQWWQYALLLACVVIIGGATQRWWPAVTSQILSAATPIVWLIYGPCMLWLHRPNARLFRALPADDKQHWRYDPV